jgi:transcriptional regulator with XRE-family HTH domain
MPRPRTKPPIKVTGSFGHRIMRFRQARGLTQEELAELLGTSQRVISYYENDAHEPNATMLSKLAEAFGVSVDDLVAIADPRQELMKRDTILARKFLEAENLPPSDRKTILQIIDALLAKHNASA